MSFSRRARTTPSFTLAITPENRRPLFSSLRRVPDPPVVGGVLTGMPAYKSGILEGDRILAVNGEQVTVWDDLPRTLEGKVDQPVRLTVKRGTRTFDIVVTPINPGRFARGSACPNRHRGAPRQRVYVERYSPALSITYGIRGTFEMIANVYGGMWLTISRPLYYREYLGGPLFIAQAAREQAKRGADSFLQFLAMINVCDHGVQPAPYPGSRRRPHHARAVPGAARRGALRTSLSSLPEGGLGRGRYAVHLDPRERSTATGPEAARARQGSPGGPGCAGPAALIARTYF
jgi:hypothetical protein